MNDLTITIVTPSYNQGSFLAETIESVIGQEGDFYLDYLIIDGGSSDASVDIMRRYAQLLAEKRWLIKCREIRFRWLSEKDRGQGDALGKGFRMAEGEILAWLNADDVYLPGALQAAVDAFRANAETALIYGEGDYCDVSGKVVGRYPVEGFDLEKLAWFNFFCQPSTFFRRAAFEALGGLDSDLHYAMDYELFVRIAKRFECRYLAQTLSRYRLHSEAKTVRNDVLWENHEEALQVALKHFSWAPLNRVYGACFYGCLARLPDSLTRLRPLTVAIALTWSFGRSLRLNRGVKLRDLALLTRENLRKLFRSRMEILRG